MTPSESSCIKRLIHLRDHLGIKGVHKVVTHEPLTSLHKLIVIQFEDGVPQTEIWRAHRRSDVPMNTELRTLDREKTSDPVRPAPPP